MFAYTKIIQGIQAVTTAVTDAYFNLVTLLLNTTSTNGAQNNTFLDSSSNNFSITRNGNTTQGTFTPFSQTGWSAYFSGSNDYLLQNSTSNWNFLHNGSSWTIQFSLYHSSTALTVLTSTANASAQVGFSLQLNGSVANDVSVAFFRGVNGSSISFSSTANLVINTWNQVGITFDGTTKTCTFYINGVQRGSSSNTGFAYSSSNSAYGLYIGTEASTLLYDFAGYLSNYRISNTVRTGMTSTLTQPFTSDSNTSLLLFQANRFFDAGNNSYTISTGGTPSVQAFSPFAPTAAYSTTTVGGSGYFDGTGDYLQNPAAASNGLGTGNYTLECWFYLNSAPASGSDRTFIRYHWTGSVGQNAVYYLSVINSAGTLYPYTFARDVTTPANNTTITSSTAIRLSTWNHVAAVRSGTTLTLYLNGVSVGSATGVSWNLTAGTNIPIYIGTYNGSSEMMNGYILGARVVKSAVYSGSTYTIPTAPPTSDGNTQLLLNFTNAGIYDAAAKNVLETVGNAQVSTTQAKFGTTSMYFDGTGDYLLSPSSQNFSLTGDFTIEGWVYRGATGSFRLLTIGDSFAATGLEIYATGPSTGNWVVYSGNATRITGAAATRGVWTYLALVRSGSTVTFYVDGTASGSTWTSSSAFSGACYVAAEVYNSAIASDTFGYIDELRITKYARTITASPTAAFPVQ